MKTKTKPESLIVKRLNKPPKTIVNHFNEIEMIKFKEPKNFETYKHKAHFYFDKIWKTKLMTREEAYGWLSEKLELTNDKTHFGLMNNMKCTEAIYYCQQLLNDIRRLDLDFGVKPITPFYII